MSAIYESEIEKMMIDELISLGYTYKSGLDIAPDGITPERQSFDDVILKDRLICAMQKLNDLPYDCYIDAYRKIRRIGSGNLVADNELFHKYLIEGVPVEYRKKGEVRGDNVKIVDFINLKNDFLVINQFTIIENGVNKRPDIILFINGLPLVVVELKNPSDENATIRKAYDQLQTYKAMIPSLFIFNEVCVISDGFSARAGSLTAPFNRFTEWKTKDGENEADKFVDQLSILTEGLLSPATLINYIRYFVTFEKEKREDINTKIITIETIKKNAAYHQYYAVNKAVNTTVLATSGTHKAGVVWHTQGSGKSLSMVFYASKIVEKLNNPTILVITDRNDLDDQLFETFASNKKLLRNEPVQADNTEQLKELLKVNSGGIVFTTIQKFSDENGAFECLTERENVVVIADEAHRTQYGLDAKLKNIKDKNNITIGQKIVYGFAKYIRDALPNATFIGFTGTPVEKKDANTPAIFGDYIDVYDIAQAVSDGVTVKIYYESRLAKVNMTENGKKLIEEFDDNLDVSELDEAGKAKVKWAKLEAIVGNKDRLNNVAKDFVEHFETRQKTLDGKVMFVAMSRRIAVDLYNEIIKLRPEWHNDDLDKGVIKVVMTSVSSDPLIMQKHHTTKTQRKALADRMKDPENELKIVIVRDMWLTGFDSPCLHTMYVDKIMKEHNLMQAIARVNRVFKDKPGGLIVDYIGIASNLKKALSFYAESGGKGMPAESQEKAVEVLIEKLEIVRNMFYGFDYSKFFNSKVNDKLTIILKAEDFILGLEDGKTRFLREVGLLSQAYALSKPHQVTIDNAEEILFFQAVKSRLNKFETGKNSSDSYESIIKTMIDNALYSDKVVDVFEAAGINKPELSVLSDEFLKEVQGMKHKNLALELLKKILKDEIKIRMVTNITKSKKLLEMLDEALKKYQNNLLTTAEIIDELINIAKEIRISDERAVKLGLTNDEVAFYDALETNDSAVKVLGDEQLRQIAVEIAEKVRKNATIDWTIKETVKAKLRVIVRRTLNKYGYPPDKQPQAINTVMKQAENLANIWAN